MIAHRLHSGEASPFVAPSTVMSWLALFLGIVGIWLVPGLWLSAVMLRTGLGPAARLATRIGATLAWYALVGPLVHLIADGARVTQGGLLGVTVAATAAVCLGVALGLLHKPANSWLRFFGAGLVGTLCAQTVIWLSMRLFDDGIDYEQIRRLDWLILLACGLLTAIGTRSRPDLPLLRTASHIRTVLVSLAVVAATATALLAVGSVWSPAQRMPSAIGIEQVAAPPGSDIAFALTALGPDGPAMIKNAAFTASDDAGRPVAVTSRLLQDGRADSGTLLLALDPDSQPQLCERSGDAIAQGWPIKLTLRDQASDLVVQAVVPAGWCTA
ncbi:hypothetical protein ACGFK1_13655 [Mycobacterium sp. NPDC048908]|uniref:hypothetical protein n=1 Tax=Mycobacterium sp. NPDC048908 TaxID=3364292 RepID=UPI003713585C